MDAEDRFVDRAAAGRALADELDDLRDADPVVLALPLGGVVLGAAVAEALDAPLDVVIARNFRAPSEGSLAVGAIAPGVLVVDDEAVRRFGLTDDQVEDLAARERTEVNRELRRYRPTDEVPDVEGRTVILVGEGFATGLRMRAALQAVRSRNPSRIVLAVGTCAAPTVDGLRDEVDAFVCGHTLESLDDVEHEYRDEEEVTEDEVKALLAAAHDRIEGA